MIQRLDALLHLIIPDKEKRNGALEANSRSGQLVDPDFVASSSVEDEVTSTYTNPTRPAEPDIL